MTFHWFFIKKIISENKFGGINPFEMIFFLLGMTTWHFTDFFIKKIISENNFGGI